MSQNGELLPRIVGGSPGDGLDGGEPRTEDQIDLDIDGREACFTIYPAAGRLGAPASPFRATTGASGARFATKRPKTIDGNCQAVSMGAQASH